VVYDLRRLRVRRAEMAKSGCPTPPLCDNRNTCLGGCKFGKLIAADRPLITRDQAELKRTLIERGGQP
jgi:hypothetical protein